MSAESAPTPAPQPDEGPKQPGQELPGGPAEDVPGPVPPEVNGDASPPDNPIEGAFMAPDMSERVPSDAKQRVMNNVYAPRITSGEISQTEAEKQAEDSVEITRVMDNEELVAANREASDVLEKVENWEEDPNADPNEEIIAFMDAHEGVEAAVDSVSRAMEALPYFDPDRAEDVLGTALQDHDLNAVGMMGVAKGLQGLTMMKGESTLPMWRDAVQATMGDSEKEEVINLALLGASQRLRSEVDAARLDPEADPATLASDTKLIAELERLVGDNVPDIAKRTLARRSEPPEAPNAQQTPAIKQFEENFDRNQLRGDPRWN